MNSKLGYISNILTALRAGIAPCLIWDAKDGHISHWFLVLFICGVLSDFFDGEILRRLKITNIQLRSLDSVMDAIFYMSVFVSMWFTHPAVIQTFIIPIAILLFTQTCSWMFSLIKYGKTTSYHSYIAKLWGATLLAGTIGFFVGQYQLFLFCVIFGIFSNMEDIFITAIMPYWKCDILNIRSARELRDQWKQSPIFSL